MCRKVNRLEARYGIKIEYVRKVLQCKLRGRWVGQEKVASVNEEGETE
jgi:hypothetical protein